MEPNKEKQTETPSADSGSKVNERVDKLEASINGMSERFNSQMSSLNQAITTVLTKNQDKEPEAQIEPDEPATDWHDQFQASPKKKLVETITPELTAMEKRIEKKVKSELTAKDEINKYDSIAKKNFPQLNNPEHPLFKETLKVLEEKGPEFADRPDSIYDASRIAYSNLVYRGEIVPDAFKDEASRLLSVSDSSLLPMNGGVVRNSQELTKSQLHFAQRLGVSPENYLKRLNALGDRKPSRD